MDNNAQLQLKEAFGVMESSLNGLSHSRFHDERKKALRLFSEVGFPHRKHEEFKYLNLVKLLKDDVKLAERESVGQVNLNDFPIPDFDAYRLVFVDGFFSDKHSSDCIDEDGIIVSSLGDAQKMHTDLLNEKFTAYDDKSTNPFALMNSAMARDGAFIHLQAGKSLDKPVHIIHINSGKQADAWVQPSHIIALEEGAKLDVVQSYFSADSSCKDNAAAMVQVNKNADLSVYTHQDLSTEATHFNTIYGYAYESARFTSYSCVLNGGMIRNNVQVYLDDHYAECNMYGLYVPTEREIVDNHTIVDHRIADCESNELYKGVVLDRAKATFNGKIFVRQDAQRTNAFQSNKNLLISEHGTINTKPQLEIWADDVKCTHGATIGQLNPAELFYMKSRGIPEDQAKSLLTYAFAGDILQRFKIEDYKNFCHKMLAKKLDFEGIESFV